MLRVLTTWGGTMSGLPYYSNLYFEGTTEGEADAALAAVIAFWQAVDNRIVDNATWTVDPTVEVVSTENGQVTGLFDGTGGTGSGNDAGDPLPPNTQGLIRWRTGDYVGGREIRGRTFIPGAPEAENAAGVPSSSYVSQMQTAASGLLTAAAGAGGLVIWSRTKLQPAAVVSASVWNQWATLRSRRD
jgi:hypothetical protein